MSIFKHPKLDVATLIARLLEGPEKIHDKAMYRSILSRLEILSSVLKELGYDKTKWQWQQVFQPLVIPGLMHANPEVRQAAINVVVQLLFFDESGVNQALQEVEGLKSNIL